MPRSKSASPRAPSKTRERILDTSLALFNQLGAPNVTTNHIADAAAISPGNLYYHFRHKEDIVLGLYDRYDTAMGEVIGGTGGEAGEVDDLWLLVHLAFEVIYDYRFIHRDLSELSTAYPALRIRFQRGLEQGVARTSAYCRTLAAQGALDATPEEALALATNISLVTTYWLNLQALRDAGRSGAPSSDGDAISHGVFQVLSLITPYLRGAVRDEFRSVALRYLPTP
jgi:AcrR family transcriptional regulator